jgi:hypothetical protein
MNLKLPFISGNDGALSLVHILPDVCQLNGRQGLSAASCLIMPQQQSPLGRAFSVGWF